MATAYISRTLGTPTNAYKGTFSAWVKRGTVATQHAFFSSSSDTNNKNQFYFTSTGALEFYGKTSSVANVYLQTTRLFRDPGAWYHIVLAWDTEQVTGTDRVKLYVNGTQYTWDAQTTQPAEDAVLRTNVSGETFMVGASQGPADYWDGDMSWVQFVDGLQLAPTEFGSVDSTSGMWKIKPGAYATPGTNGFTLAMEDRTNLDLDSSSNAHTMTTSGTLTATYDNPSNNFCTMNPLNRMGGSSPTWAYGNNTYTQGGSSQYYPAAGTIGLSAGLWYWEGTYNSSDSSLFGIAGDSSIAQNMVGTSNNYIGYTSEQWSLYTASGLYYNGGSNTSYGVAVAYGDIIGIYLDLTANKLYFANNGTIMNSGTGISITAAASTPSGFYVPASCYYGGSNTFNFNFGNGYLATTAVTSAVADEGGYGAFEYDPSAGTFDGTSKDFRAICTNNLKTYGG